MGKVGGITTFDRSPIYTLAQSGTAIGRKKVDKGKRLQGKGTELGNKSRLLKWAKKKLISQTLVLKLADLARQRGDLDQMQSYYNTWHCFNKVTSANGRLFGKYCGNRFCPLCCGIRKAKKINQYLPVLKNWKDPFFLTITAQSVDCDSLERRTDEMFILLRQIIAKHKKRFQRAKGQKFMGVYSFECNFSPIKQTYNPHFHLILPDLKTADTILVEWRKRGLEKWGKETVKQAAQCNKRVKDIEKNLVEILKYSSKIFTEPDDDKQKKVDPVICVAAYYNIIEVMKGRRIFDRFGFNLPERVKPIQESQVVDSIQEWCYSMKYTDWIQIEGEQVLTGYSPPDELMNILENKIDLELH